MGFMKPDVPKESKSSREAREREEQLSAASRVRSTRLGLIDATNDRVRRFGVAALPQSQSGLSSTGNAGLSGRFLPLRGGGLGGLTRR